VSLTPLVLEGRRVRLEPLSLDHLDDLCEVGLDEDLWLWAPEPIQTREDMLAYINEALREQAATTALPFVIVDKALGKPAGSTRFGSIDLDNRRVEIGWTWIGGDWQRTFVNTETKYIMLCHAFETLKCIRVELKTDSLNLRSRAAIKRIGAKEEGTLRNHMTMVSGRLRHTVYYSILDSEWPRVKSLIETKLGR
jgi:RimJ/RimL family protein N-acetyltransferase